MKMLSEIFGAYTKRMYEKTIGDPKKPNLTIFPVGQRIHGFLRHIGVKLSGIEHDEEWTFRK